MNNQPIDIKLVERSDGIIDIELDENGDLLVDEGFGTTIRLSIFGRRRATAAEVPIQEYRGGWIGNIFSSIPNFQAGSKLWLLDQSRIDASTANNAKNYIQESLEWFKDDGLANEVETSTQISLSALEALIVIDGDSFFFDIWNLTKN